MEDSIHHILDYLLRKHGDVAQAQLQYLGITPRILNEYEVATTMDKANLGIGQWRTLVQCLKTYLELDTFCVSETAWRKIGHDHAKIHTDVYEHVEKEGERSEKCKWWTMNAMDKLNSKNGGLMNGIKDFDPLKIDYIHTTYGGDQGEGKFRFVSKHLVRLNNGIKYKLTYPLVDIICHKDSGKFLKNAIIPNLRDRINKVEESSVKIELNTKTKNGNVSFLMRMKGMEMLKSNQLHS